MQSIEQALKEVQSLHEQLTHTPAPQIAPHAFLPFPPGSDPVTYAIGEVSQLKQMIAGRAPGATTSATWMPRASVFAGESTVCFVVELAGVAKEDLTVTVAGGELVVRGERRPQPSNVVAKPVLMELSAGPFERRFPVPTWCNPESVTARCAHGVLEIQLSRPEEETSGEFCVEIA